jgi:hypothetical protein
MLAVKEPLLGHGRARWSGWWQPRTGQALITFSSGRRTVGGAANAAAVTPADGPDAQRTSRRTPPPRKGRKEPPS